MKKDIKTNTVAVENNNKVEGADMKKDRLSVKSTIVTFGMIMAIVFVGAAGVNVVKTEIKEISGIERVADITGERHEVGNAVYTDTEYKYFNERLKAAEASGLDEKAATVKAITETQDAMLERNKSFTQEELDNMTEAEWQEYFGK